MVVPRFLPEADTPAHWVFLPARSFTFQRRQQLVLVHPHSSDWGRYTLLHTYPRAVGSHFYSYDKMDDMDLDVKFRKRVDRAHSYYSDAAFFTPIARRAWCFQEKLLASRCLVFCEDEVVWECQSCCMCECSVEQEHFSGGES